MKSLDVKRKHLEVFGNLPSLHPLSFHEMIFLLVPLVFSPSLVLIYMCMRNKKNACEGRPRRIPITRKGFVHGSSNGVPWAGLRGKSDILFYSIRML